MLPYTTPDFQHPDTGIPCIFEWVEETGLLSLQPCENVIDAWHLEQEQPEALAETIAACKRFHPQHCANLEIANEIIANTRYYDNGDNIFCVD